MNPQSNLSDGGAGGAGGTIQQPPPDMSSFDGGNAAGGGSGGAGGKGAGGGGGDGDAGMSEDGGTFTRVDAGEPDAGVCVPKTCDEVAEACGDFSDGCGRMVYCGCDSFSQCKNQQCVCNSTVDEPDDQFLDTNCDGIDGDAKRAIFVSAEGNDDADGTRSSPVATFQRALQLVSPQRSELYVSEGSYEAPRQAWPSAIRVFGGYRKNTWKRANENRAVLTTIPFGMLVQNCTAEVVFDRLVVRSSPYDALPYATQAIRIIDCAKYVTLNHVEVISVDGAHGIDGDPGEWGPDGFAGTDGVVVQNSGYRTPGGEFYAPGGAGGIGSNTQYPVPENSGGIGMFNTSPAAASRAWSCNVGDKGENGAAGLDGQKGEDNVTGRWTDGLDDRGVWFTEGGNGMNGGPGAFGQGGNGGAGGGASYFCMGGPSNVTTGGYGGGGGGGGSGGRGGKGGIVGGSSVAMVVIRSQPSLINVNLITGRGGDGGRGGPGGMGGRGGSGGLGAPPQVTTTRSGAGGDGGNGGRGGQGGRGGDGRGGSSIAIFCRGVDTWGTLKNVTVSLGAKGKGGDGISDGLQVETRGCPTGFR